MDLTVCDDLDKTLFFQEILNYLDEDIDKMNVRFDGKIGISTRQYNLKSKKGDKQSFKPGSLPQQNIIISKNFDK